MTPFFAGHFPRSRGEGRIRNQPSFCPICGNEYTMLPPLLSHLHAEHKLLGRDAWVPYRVAWRELNCALLGITDPEWERP